MSTIPVENLRIKLNASLRLHVDRAEMRAANWVCSEGWVADWPRGEIEIASGWRGDAYCVLSKRPDVCQALELEADLAWGFILHLLDAAPAPAGQMEASLSRDRAVFTVWILPCPQHVAVLIFRHPRSHCPDAPPLPEPRHWRGRRPKPHIQFLPHGVIAPRDLVFGFDNTRIGNYHPDILEILSRPGAIGLDIGCGLRDRVFDNLVTQDIYPTPTATIVTRPEDSPPFADGVFDLIVLDSVLEHVPDSVALLTEAHRLLRPGGKIFGDVPFCSPCIGTASLFQFYPLRHGADGHQGRIATGIHPLPKLTSARNSPWNGCCGVPLTVSFATRLACCAP